MLDRFGEDSAQWPEQQRAAVAVLLEENPSARAALLEAARIRSLLKRRPITAPDRLLQAIDESLNAEPMRGAQRLRAIV
jgi:hypothetical protein